MIYRFSARKALVHAVAVATVLWAFAVVVQFAGSTNRSIAGPLKGTDFVQFYTLGFIARHNPRELYDAHAFHARQSELVPESADLIYPPVYPPQIALVSAPLSAVPYQTALMLWLLLSITAYFVIVRTVWLSTRGSLPGGHLVAAAAAAFPPFWQCVMHGQITMLLAMSIAAGWKAMEGNRRFLAGVAFGFLALKPQFAIVCALVALVTREWRLLAGALVSVGAQVVVVSAVLGSMAWHDFLASIPSVVTHADLLSSKAYHSHSFRMLFRALPPFAGTAFWLAGCAWIVSRSIRMWRTEEPLTTRLAVLLLATLLVSPHLMIYDLSLLALPLLWIPSSPALVYAVFATTLIPSVGIIGFQLSVPVLLYFFVKATSRSSLSAYLSQAPWAHARIRSLLQ